LVALIKNLENFEHQIFYYGQSSVGDVTKVLNKLHKVNKTRTPVLPAKKYEELNTDKDLVYFVNFPMVQAEVLMISKGTPQYNQNEEMMARIYNNYFGAGLSSIVFQEIREARALAYSASAFYTSPAKKDRAHIYQAYVGTQADKIKEAIPAMREIIDNMPISEAQIEQARQSVMKQIESERITKSAIYWTSKSNMDKGIDYDYRKDVYGLMQKLTPADLKAFQEKHVKGRKFTILVLGDKKRVDMEYLKTLGEVKELALDEIFNY
jgi:predicted Zn-dependent peptidase